MKRAAWIAGAIAVAAAGAVLVPGVAQVPPPPVRVCVVAEPCPAAPFTITVTSARVVTSPEWTVHDTVLVVTGDVTTANTRPVDSGTLSEAIQTGGTWLTTPPGATGLTGADQVRHADDETGVGMVQPTISYPAMWVYPVTGPVPDQVDLALVAHTYRQSRLDQTMQWFDPVVVATLTVAVDR